MMLPLSSMSRAVARCLAGLLVVQCLLVPPRAQAQFWKRVTQGAACLGGGAVGVKLGEKVAELDARRRNLSPAEAASHKKAFQIGMALALCGGGAMVAGTAYSRLSDRGKQAREKEIMAALEDAQPTPRAYTDPETPSLQGVVTAQPAMIEDNEECRVVQDQLAADQALVKYCRSADGRWSVKNI